MITFIYHDNIANEIRAIEKKIRNLRENGFKPLERLFEQQFHPQTPKQVIGPGKLHRITQNDLWVLWKVEMIVIKANLRPNQYPRVWFAVMGDKISFLCIAAHTENYDDDAMTQKAIQRATGIF